MKKTMFFFLQSIVFLFVALFTFFERVVSSIYAKFFFSLVKSLFSILKWHFTRLKLMFANTMFAISFFSISFHRK